MMASFTDRVANNFLLKMQFIVSESLRSLEEFGPGVVFVGELSKRVS